MGRFFDLLHSAFDRYDPDEMEPNEHDFQHDDWDDKKYINVYDEEGEFVSCYNPVCDGIVKWRNKHYICPECGEIMSRRDFFNAIGAEPPGAECIRCDRPYPKCPSCPYGYESVL